MKNNTKNFGSLLKYIFSLNRISLESTKKVINNIMLIKNNITNLCDKLRDIMNELNAATNNQMRLYNLQRELKENAKCKVGLIPYEVNEPYNDVECREVNCDYGWFVLYCKSCSRVCHKKCKGTKEV